MPGREYLIKGLSDKDVQAYLDFQIDLAVLLGADEDRARIEQTEAVQFEIDLAFVRTSSVIVVSDESICIQFS